MKAGLVPRRPVRPPGRAQSGWTRRQRPAVRQIVRAKDLKEVLKSGIALLKDCRSKWRFAGGLEPDPAYIEGGDFLRSIGMTNQAEISRVLDIAMNPDSLFLSAKERQMSTASVHAPVRTQILKCDSRREG